MDKPTIKDSVQSPLIKSNHFLTWLKEHPNLEGADPFQLYEELHAGKKLGRLYFDGAFDVVHSGHYNAIRQAKQICHTLVVGVNSDEGIAVHKGPPVMNLKERCTLVEACKWTDELAAGTPYVADIALLDSLNCQYIGHGDDIIYGPDGKSIYSPFEDVGRLKITKRTEGISTTDILGRILDLKDDTKDKQHDLDDVVRFVNRASMLEQFMHLKQPLPDQKIVYVDGSFDLLHPGHVAFLKAAKARGDYLIVGVHDNSSIRDRKGAGFPIIDLNERILCVLAMKYVDDVVIGAPQKPNETFLKRLGITLVLSGKNGEQDSQDSYKYAKQLGIYEEIDIGKELTSRELIERIQANQGVLKEVFERKKKKQEEMYKEITSNK